MKYDEVIWVCVKTLAPLSFASKCIKIAGAHGCSPPIRLAFHNLIPMSCDNSRQSPRCSKTGRRNRGGPERAAGWQLGKECWQSIVGPKKIENLHQRHHQTWKGFPKLHFLGKSIWCSPWHFLDSSRHVTPQRRVLPLFWDAGSKVAHLCCRACRRMKSMKSLKRRLAAQWSPKTDAEHGDYRDGSSWPLENQFRTFGCSGCGS